MIDIAILFVLVEVLVMLVWSRSRRVLPILMPTLVAGLMLMLAWRATQADMPWPWIAAPLLCSALAHLADLCLFARRTSAIQAAPFPAVGASPRA